MTVQWTPNEMEAEYGRHLLRVNRTRSPYRFSWFVVPLQEVKKGPMWFSGVIGKGSSRALARGYSRTFEKAQQDAIAMSDAIVKSEVK